MMDLNDKNKQGLRFSASKISEKLPKVLIKQDK